MNFSRAARMGLSAFALLAASAGVARADTTSTAAHTSLAPSAPATQRFFVPSAGFKRARDLPDSLKGRISSLEFDINDAFEGSETHSDLERTLYSLGNDLHVNTRESTLRRRLTFREKDTVTVDALREAEKNLRGEEFLADAIIEVKRLPDSTLAVKVTTYDQWTTVPAVSIGRSGGEWVWWVGPKESNLLGTGQRLDFFVGHDLVRDSRWIDYGNSAFTENKLRLIGYYAWLSDGFAYNFSVSRPLLTRTDRWAFTLAASGQEYSEDQYLSGNALDRLDREGKLDSAGRALLGKTNILWQRNRTATHDIYADVTRSFGYVLKTSVTPFYSRETRDTVAGYGLGSGVPRSVRDSLGIARDSAGFPVPTLPFDQHHDEVLGVTFSLYEYALKTVHNFHNLKWSENIETGWRLSASFGRNQEWLGAKNPDWYFSYSGVYNDAWKDAFLLNSRASMRYFLSDAGDPDNGSASAYAEVQWKPAPLVATVLTGQWDNLFAVQGNQQLYLGEESGLLGYPNFYYAGRARILCSAEQRFFPPVEFGTVVPAVAVFLDAGNAFDRVEQANLGDLHYSAGVGLRLGATRSVQKVVNHINLTWPLGEKNLSAVTFGVRASKSL